MGFWVKNTSGQNSASLTFVTIGFIVVSLWLTASIVSKIGHLEIREFDSAQAMGYLTPLLALYFGRRWTDGKNTLDTDQSQLQDGNQNSAAPTDQGVTAQQASKQ